MRNYLLIVLLAVLHIGCQKEQEANQVTIEIKATEKAGVEVFVNSYNVFSEKTILASTTLDALGNGSISFPVLLPQFAYYEIGDLRGQLYLEPGYELSIKSIDNRLEISGKGSAITNYFKQTATLEDSLINSRNALFFSIDRFQNQLDTLENSIETSYLDFISKNEINENQKTMLNKVNSIQKALVKATYSLINNSKLTSTEKEIDNRFILDKSMVSYNLYNYNNLVFWSFTNTYYNGLGATESFSEEHLLKVNEKIASDSIDIQFKEIFAVQNINSWMFDHGITPTLDTIFQRFQKNFPNSSYQALLENNYSRYDSISPGKLAPAFKGTTLEGDTISLTDLRGKILYLDVWATWCAPCIEQFPHSIALKEKLIKNGKDVEFVYISIDQDAAKWKEFLTQAKAPIGIHILNNETFSDTYYINFTPRYILIDRDGKIINAYAPRPSTEGLVEVLARL